MDMAKSKIAQWISELLTDTPAQEIIAMLEYPKEESLGDLSLPCFKLSKKLRKSPMQIATELKEALEAKTAEDEFIDRIEAVSGYLNLFLKQSYLAGNVVLTILNAGERYGSRDIGAGKTIVIDFSSPNIAKPFHVGHLRSTVIGNALYRIHSFLGYQSIGVNHLGDWGTQFGKLIVAYRLWGDEARLKEGAIDELLGLYVKFHEEAERDPDLVDEARACFLKMEQGDDEMLALWQRFVDISLAEFQKIYDLLGVEFDYFTGESFYNDKMEPVIQELKDKQLLEEDEGAWLVRLDQYNMAPALMLKKDGSTLYHTRDVTAALYRKQTYSFDKALYVTDYAQNLHFAQLFKVVGLMGYDWAEDEMIHVPFGRVTLEGMSLSTRKGNVVKLEEVLEQTIKKVKEIIEVKNPQLQDKDKVARQVGVGAVIFNDLSANRIKDIVFSWDDALSFEGETGPYAQYCYARTCSVLRKAADDQFPGKARVDASLLAEQFDPTKLQHPTEIAILKELALFPERTVQAAAKLEPSIVTRYLIDLAQAFNRFYHDCPILVEDEKLRAARLALVKCVQITLRNGFSLIGLQAPEEM